MTRLTPKLHLLMIFVSPKSFKCNISMNNGPITLKFVHRGAVSIEEYIYRVNMAHNYGKIGAIKGKYAQIRVIKPKCSQI